MESVRPAFDRRGCVYAEALESIAQEYTVAEAMLDPGRSLEGLLALDEQLDEAWRKDGFEGMTSFLLPEGLLIGLGRKLKEHEIEDYQKAWRAGNQPIKVSFSAPTAQTYRVFFGGEIRDVVIPAEIQSPSFTLKGFEDVDYIVSVYATSISAVFDENLMWLISKLGPKLGLSYGDGRARSMGLGHREWPSLENVVRRVKGLDTITAEANP